MAGSDLIVAALGLGAGATDDAVVDLYARLRTAVIELTDNDPLAERILDRYARNPAGYETPVRDLISDAKADQSEQVLQMAEDLLKAAKPEGANENKYKVDVSRAQGVQVGDRNVQANNFQGDFATFLEQIQKD